MYKEIKDLKIKDERKALKISERMAEDKVRYDIENKYHKDILKICELLYEKTRTDGDSNEPA
jgi:arabinogalactan endo-1,4-beta-galactosidase